MNPKKFEIYLVGLDPAIGSEMAKLRPAVVVSPDEMNRQLATVVVCPMTTTLHPKWAGRVQTRADGRDGEIAVDQIRTVSKQRLVKRLGRVTAEESVELCRVIVEMYGTY
jgi:mRNA interferase MazF